MKHMLHFLKAIALVTIGALLIFFCNPSYATLWIPFWHGIDSNSYYDPTSVRKVDKGIEVEVMTDFNGVLQRPNGTTYMSMTTTEFYDCKSGLMSFGIVRVWSAPQAEGNLIYTENGSTWTSLRIEKGSNSDALYQLLCNSAHKPSAEDEQ